MVNWLKGNELQLDDWTWGCRINSIQVSAQELRVFGLFIVTGDSSVLVDYDTVTEEMIVSFMIILLHLHLMMFFDEKSFEQKEKTHPHF